MSKTQADLKEAFAGESQANRKYLAFARQADREGLKAVARLFRAVAEAETVHALAHLHALKAVGTTEGNLKAAIAGEVHEYSDMYPSMIARAHEEGNKAAERSFAFANVVEEMHAGLYRQALEQMAGMELVDYQVCSVCGCTVAGEAPEQCPVCQAHKKAFFLVQ